MILFGEHQDLILNLVSLPQESLEVLFTFDFGYVVGKIHFKEVVQVFFIILVIHEYQLFGMGDDLSLLIHSF